MNYDIRNVLSDKKKLSIIAGVTVVGLSIGSIGLKLHKEHTNPSTPPVSADEVDANDKMSSQLKTENKKLNAQKTKSNNSSNELVPYNLNGRLGSLGGDYSYTPNVEPTVYEPIIEPTLEPVEDEIIEETDTSNVSEPIVNEVVKPTEPPVTNEEGIVEKPAINEASKFNVNTATYKGRNIVKHLPNMTYDVIDTDNNVIIEVTGNNIHIQFTRVNNNEFNCTKLVKNGQELTGMERDKVLNTIFEINEGESNNHVVIPPDQPPVIEFPDQPSSKPVEEPTPEQPKDDKVETEDNTGVTAPPVTPPAPTAPPEAELVVG